jgi:hypothetical protein
LLRISFVKGLVWAGSNIYWDDSKLTFAPAGVDFGDIRQSYQGVYFLWGSLVGLSPAVSQVTGVDWDPSTTSGTVRYVPTYTDAATHSWAKAYGGSWESIPHYYPRDIVDPSVYGTNKDFFSTLHATGTTALYQARHGDICRYLGDTGDGPAGYRMPTLDELEKGRTATIPSTVSYTPENWLSAAAVAGYWTRMGNWTLVSDYITDPSGRTSATTPLAGSRFFTAAANYSGYTRFPASGVRGLDGLLYDVGGSCNYWSASCEIFDDLVYNRPGAYYMDFEPTWMRSAPFVPRYSGFSVRCLKDE